MGRAHFSRKPIGLLLQALSPVSAGTSGQQALDTAAGQSHSRETSAQGTAEALSGSLAVHDSFTLTFRETLLEGSLGRPKPAAWVITFQTFLQ